MPLVRYWGHPLQVCCTAHTYLFGNQFLFLFFIFNILYLKLCTCNGVTRDIGEILRHSFLDTGEWCALWTRIYVFAYIYADISAINICWNMLNLAWGTYLKWMGTTMIFGCHWDTPLNETTTSQSCVACLWFVQPVDILGVGKIEVYKYLRIKIGNDRIYKY